MLPLHNSAIQFWTLFILSHKKYFVKCFFKFFEKIEKMLLLLNLGIGFMDFYFDTANRLKAVDFAGDLRVFSKKQKFFRKRKVKSAINP